MWVTFDTPQSRSLLEGEKVHYVPYVAPRDWRTVASNVPRAVRILRAEGIRTLYTTGSGIANSFLPPARALGVECHYIESAARSLGPSLTGRIAARIPGVHTYTQYDTWASARWPRSASVFDDFVPVERCSQVDVQSVVVTLGTISGYGFRSLVDRIRLITPPHVRVLWQTGETRVEDLPIDARAFLPQSDLTAECSAADAVIAHAGIGSALGVLSLGRTPVLVPRRQHRGEHVDDHQTQIAFELAQRGLAVHREVDALTWADVCDAASRRVRRR